MEQEVDDKQVIPYEDGDHCIFYAVQAAVGHFVKESMTYEERKQYQYERGKRAELLKKIMGKESSLGIGILMSLSMIVNKLKDKRIEPAKFYGISQVKALVESVGQIKRMNIPFDCTEDSEGIDEFELPAIFFIETPREEADHVWCPTTEEELERDLSSHIREDDKVVLIMELRESSRNDRKIQGA